MVNEQTQADLEYERAMKILDNQEETNGMVNSTGGFSFDVNKDNFTSSFNSAPDKECTLSGEFIGIRRNPFGSKTEGGERDVAVDFKTVQLDDNERFHSSSITWNTDRSPWVMRTILDNLNIEYSTEPFSFDIPTGFQVDMVFKRASFKRGGQTVSEIQLSEVHTRGSVEQAW